MLTHLLLMRHAKSSWDDPNLSDHERVLNKRGRKAASAMGKALHKRGFAPDLIWSSDAQRTRETALRLVRNIPGGQVIKHSPEFYHASVDDILRTCQHNGQPDASKLMLLGHNPAWSDLYEYFSGQFVSFPTAACAIFKITERPVVPPEPSPSIIPPVYLDRWLQPEHWTYVDLILPRTLGT